MSEKEDKNLKTKRRVNVWDAVVLRIIYTKLVWNDGIFQQQKFRFTYRDALEIPNAPYSLEIVSGLTTTEFSRIQAWAKRLNCMRISLFGKFGASGGIWTRDHRLLGLFSVYQGDAQTRLGHRGKGYQNLLQISHILKHFVNVQKIC